MIYSVSMRIIAEKLVPGGMCFSRIAGKATFVRGALPGETVEADIVSEKHDYTVTRVSEILEPSPCRVVPVCPLFGRCGGCSLQMADDAYQTELRLSILREALSRFHVPCAKEPVVSSGSAWEYRSRFQFHRAGQGVALKAGESSDLVTIGDCPVAVKEIRAALADGTLASMSSLREDEDRFHVFGHNGQLWHEDRECRAQIDIAGKTISLDVRGFFQSNIPMLGRVAVTIEGLLRELPQRKRLLDLYSGVGTFLIFSGSLFESTVLVEHNREALAIARENLARIDVDATVCAVSDDVWPTVPLSRLPFDAAVVDPPRTGISRAALSWLCESAIPELLYVSCDPVTFSRDAAILTKAGYTLSNVWLEDFYPQTHHVETLGHFRR